MSNSRVADPKKLKRGSSASDVKDKRFQMFTHIDTASKSFSGFTERMMYGEKISEDSVIDDIVNEKPKTAADGLGKGLLSLGHNLVKGVTGIVVEPVKGAKHSGGVGFLKGVAVGLTGVVTKPVVGVVDLVAKTSEGIANTPHTIHNALMIAREPPQEDKIAHFGQPLSSSVQKADDQGKIHIAFACYKHIRENGLQSVGIFRLAASKKTLLKLRDQVDSGETLKLDQFNMNTVACLYKLYFAELPDSVIPSSSYYDLLRMAEQKKPENEIVMLLKPFVKNLEAVNRHVLLQLMDVLYEIHKQSKVNKMDAHNLSVVWVQNVLKAPPATPDQDENAYLMQLLRNAPKLATVIKVMIEHFEEIFSITAEDQSAGNDDGEILTNDCPLD